MAREVILRPIFVLRFWTSEGLTQAESKFKRWNSRVHREFSGDFESTDLNRDNLSREIGCSEACAVRTGLLVMCLLVDCVYL